MCTPLRRLGLVAIIAGLAACGGGGDGGGAVFVNAPDTSRGSLVISPPVRESSLSATELKVLLDLTSSGKALVQVGGVPKCGIDVRSLEYRTVGGRGEPTTASGALMLPTGGDPACTGARPIVLYGHGTSELRDFDMARLTDTGQAAAGESAVVAALFAAQGYIVVAPNYAGYDNSPLPYHPYLNGEQQGKDMADALSAARKSLPGLALWNGQILVTGYSQGGYAALAAHRELQAAGVTVTASAPLSAPSAISLLVDYSFSGWPALGATVFTPLITTSWQRQFGDIYSATGDIYEAQYATGIDTLLPGAASTDQLYATGKLPPLALYPANATPGPISPDLAIFYGPNNLIRQSYLTQVANDVLANPCPGNALPASNASLATTTPLNCKPLLGFRRAAVTNDLRNWLPARPVMMCGGAQDPAINFVSTLATAGYFRARGMPASALTVLDLEQLGAPGDPFAAFRVGFAAAKANLAANTPGSAADKALAVTRSYHGSLVPPFCAVAARAFFEAVVAAGL